MNLSAKPNLITWVAFLHKIKMCCLIIKINSKINICWYLASTIYSILRKSTFTVRTDIHRQTFRQMDSAKVLIQAEKQTDDSHIRYIPTVLYRRQTYRQTDRQTDRIDRKGWQTDQQTDRQTIYECCVKKSGQKSQKQKSLWYVPLWVLNGQIGSIFIHFYICSHSSLDNAH